jgi:hypothetical protein
MNRFSSPPAEAEPVVSCATAERAKVYDRIAGHFCGSTLETAGEALEIVQGPIRLVCNSGLHPQRAPTVILDATRARQASSRTQPTGQEFWNPLRVE